MCIKAAASPPASVIQTNYTYVQFKRLTRRTHRLWAKHSVVFPRTARGRNDLSRDIVDF